MIQEINILEMKPLQAYEVTKSSTDGTFEKGDIIWKSLNGDINDATVKGWIPASELTRDTTDFAVKESEIYTIYQSGSCEIVEKITKKRGEK